MVSTERMRICWRSSCGRERNVFGDRFDVGDWAMMAAEDKVAVNT